ncbi:hypothetical protein ACOI1H_19135 [Loktanella sp. DJP18]|uniref:hypothetical protein n=1 Tax=Loktanella sp. DJP18 TaxID=3409788 RepID=UPI003BB76268
MALIDLLEESDFEVPVGTPAAAEAIDIIAAYTSPLPAAAAEANWRGYAALSQLDPENASYAEKSARYKEAYDRARSAALGKLKKKTDEFSGMLWYKHPNTPRYTDIRHYIEIYMGEKDGKVTMRLVLNYTSDSWLFIDSAAANIDGEIVPLPLRDWTRDNDTEIWERADVQMTDQLRDIAMRIANSNKTIIRFDGDQFYDDMTVRANDKAAIRDMFDAEVALKAQLADQ